MAGSGVVAQRTGCQGPSEDSSGGSVTRPLGGGGAWPQKGTSRFGGPVGPGAHTAGRATGGGGAGPSVAAQVSGAEMGQPGEAADAAGGVEEEATGAAA